MASPFPPIPLYPDFVPHYQGYSPHFVFTPRLRCDDGETLRPVSCRLDTGLTISVLPRPIWKALNVEVRALPGWRGQPVPPWCGVRCRVGRIWLDLDPRVVHPLVRIPVTHKRWMPPYLLLGTDFLRQYRAEVRLDCGNLDPALGYLPCGEMQLP